MLTPVFGKVNGAYLYGFGVPLPSLIVGPFCCELRCWRRHHAVRPIAETEGWGGKTREICYGTNQQLMNSFTITATFIAPDQKW